jgi:hypothetical protein
VPYPEILFCFGVFVLIICALASLPTDSLGAGEAYAEDESEDDAD